MGTELVEDPLFWADQEPRMLDNEFLEGRVVGVLPKNQVHDAILAVPVDLLSEEFAWMSRIWILNEGINGEVRLTSKTRLAGQHALRIVDRRIIKIH